MLFLLARDADGLDFGLVNVGSIKGEDFLLSGITGGVLKLFEGLLALRAARAGVFCSVNGFRCGCCCVLMLSILSDLLTFALLPLSVGSNEWFCERDAAVILENMSLADDGGGGGEGDGSSCSMRMK